MQASTKTLHDQAEDVNKFDGSAM